jgi:hypothetical protein
MLVRTDTPGRQLMRKLVRRWLYRGRTQVGEKLRDLDYQLQWDHPINHHVADPAALDTELGRIRGEYSSSGLVPVICLRCKSERCAQTTSPDMRACAARRTGVVARSSGGAAGCAAGGSDSGDCGWRFA